MHNNSKQQSIDYDAIMKSIKINQSINSSMSIGQRKEQQKKMLESGKKIKQFLGQVRNSKSIIQETKSKDQLISLAYNRNVYSSIVQDDLYKETCFESVYRPQCIDQHPILAKPSKHKNQQFLIYETSNTPLKNGDKKQITPKKVVRKGTLDKKLLNWDDDKQNNGLIQNGENQRVVRDQHRYLSHTETSQKKIKIKRVGISSIVQKSMQKKRESSNSGIKYKRQKGKSGIEVINEKYYHS